MSDSRATHRALAFAVAALALSACVQTNVGRAPLEESNEPRRVERATPVSAPPSPSPSPAPAPSPSPSVSPSPAPAEDPSVVTPAPTPAPAASAAPPQPSVPAPSPSPVPVAPKSDRAGEPFVLQAAPCKAQGRHVRVPIPRREELDGAYQGAASGIEIRRTLRSGAAGFRHARLVDGVLEADLWARGSGVAVGALGSEACKGGEAADVTFEVIAHYR